MTCIHIIDDDDALREALAHLIAARTGQPTRSWRSGAAFLEALPVLEPAVVLIDHHVRGVSGLDVLRAIDGDPRFTVVVMAAAADVRLAVDVLRAGAVHLIEKPCESDVVIEAIGAARTRLEANMPVIGARAQIARLAPRERDVLLGMVAGLPNKSIARELGISPRTVEIYRKTLMDKLGAESLAAALQIALTAGFVPEDDERPFCLAA